MEIRLSQRYIVKDVLWCDVGVGHARCAGARKW